MPILDPIRSLLWSTDGPRLRASWRLLLSWGLLFVWSVVAALAAGFTKPFWNTFPGPARQILNIGVGTAVFLALFALFARYVDRRPLSNYGFARSPTWVAELAVGFLAVLVGTALWHALGVVLGWTTLEFVLDTSDVTDVLWLLALLLPWYLSGLTQSLLSVALVTKNAAEGLHARGASLAHAVAGAVVVAFLFFTLRHSPTTATRVLSLVFGGTVFTLLYVHSGNLALSIGALGSANYTNQFVFSNPSGGPPGDWPEVVHLSQSLPEAVDLVAQTNLPALVFTYLLAVAWLAWRRDGLAIHPSLAQWRPREDTRPE
ncbi:hypothetical protein BRD00_00100 [Halobacteriales archaeon QS_8_69_26]|nr:MAG: hypothetical protein BRD00_00100 [Halobacteriales archaeon QS_8_69_26]